MTFGDKGDHFIVIDGPQEADNYTWWHITDPETPRATGGLPPIISMSPPSSR